MKKRLVLVSFVVALLFYDIAYAKGIPYQSLSLGLSPSIGVKIGETVSVSTLPTLHFKIQERYVIMLRGGVIGQEEWEDYGDWIAEFSGVFRYSYTREMEPERSTRFLFDPQRQKFLRQRFYNRLRPYVEVGVGTSLHVGIGIELYAIRMFSLGLGAIAGLSFLAEEEAFFAIPSFSVAFWPF